MYIWAKVWCTSRQGIEVSRDHCFWKKWRISFKSFSALDEGVFKVFLESFRIIFNKMSAFKISTCEIGRVTWIENALLFRDRASEPSVKVIFKMFWKCQFCMVCLPRPSCQPTLVKVFISSEVPSRLGASRASSTIDPSIHRTPDPQSQRVPFYLKSASREWGHRSIEFGIEMSCTSVASPPSRKLTIKRSLSSPATHSLTHSFTHLHVCLWKPQTWRSWKSEKRPTDVRTRMKWELRSITHTHRV